MLYPLDDFPVGHFERLIETSEIGKAFIDTVLLDVICIAPYDVDHKARVADVGGIVARHDDHLRELFAKLENRHATRNAHGLGFVASRGDNATIGAGDDRKAAETRVFGDFNRHEERVTVEVEEASGAGVGVVGREEAWTSIISEKPLAVFLEPVSQLLPVRNGQSNQVPKFL